jgi:hypothetical protein
MKKYANIGEVVKVIIPKTFERCGYNLNRGVLMTERKKEMKDLILKAYNSLEFTHLPEGIQISLKCSYIDTIPSYVRSKFEQAVCAAVIAHEGFGGKERKVFEINNPYIEGKMAKVTAKKYVRTGTYYHGYTSYDGEDYEPSGLDNPKTECIYTLDLHPSTLPLNLDVWQLYTCHSEDNVKILATNCQRECE